MIIITMGKRVLNGLRYLQHFRVRISKVARAYANIYSCTLEGNEMTLAFQNTFPWKNAHIEIQNLLKFHDIILLCFTIASLYVISYHIGRFYVQTGQHYLILWCNSSKTMFISITIMQILQISIHDMMMIWYQLLLMTYILCSFSKHIVFFKYQRLRSVTDTWDCYIQIWKHSNLQYDTWDENDR